MVTRFRICAKTTIWLILCVIIIALSQLVASASIGNENTSGKTLASQKEEKEYLDYEKERWLEDFDTGLSYQHGRYDLDHDVMMQADSPPINDDYRGHDTQELVSVKRTLEIERPECPPPPQSRPPYLCDVSPCDSDKACIGRGLMCCYNGCKYTCMVSLPPKSYIDWMGQPRSRLRSGSSWLVQGKEDRTEVDWCSTTEVYYEDEEPLLCPQGHICHIDDLGDPSKGIPNRGRCVALQSQTSDEMKRRYKIVTGDGSVDKCLVGHTTYANGSTFLYDKHVCNCIDGSVLCKVGHRNKPSGDLT